MINITKQILGAKTLIKLRADSKAELIRHFWYYINYGKSVKIRRGSEIEHDTGLNWLNISETEAYFTADLKEFIKTLQSIELHRLTNDLDYNEPISPEITDLAQKRGLNIFNNIPEENILNPKELVVCG